MIRCVVSCGVSNALEAERLRRNNSTRCDSSSPNASGSWMRSFSCLTSSSAFGVAIDSGAVILQFVQMLKRLSKMVDRSYMSTLALGTTLESPTNPNRHTNPSAFQQFDTRGKKFRISSVSLPGQRILSASIADSDAPIRCSPPRNIRHLTTLPMRRSVRRECVSGTTDCCGIDIFLEERLDCSGVTRLIKLARDTKNTLPINSTHS